MRRALGSPLAVLAMVALGWTPGPTLAYPIPPETLWSVTADAQLVVVARVAEV